MATILVNEKNAVAKGITITGYITEATHTRLQVSGVNLLDIAKLFPLKNHMLSGFNAITFNLNQLDYSVLAE